MSTSDQVVDILVEQGGYRLLPQPLKIGSQPFEFTHALVAERRANDLVIVMELKGSTADHLVARRMLALTRALDVLHSKRPVTVVFTTGQPGREILNSIGRVCRILSVGNPTGPEATDTLRDWLAALLPFVQPAATDIKLDWEADLRRFMPDSASGPLAEALIAAAPQGRECVESVLADSFNRTVQPSLDRAGAPE
ncbi:hypothetical protein N5E02_00445 [Stenotrophomonas sp. GD03777]|uniref:hypothetical protein n=1 Tax=Stenotrophomonas sp. GD03777 TaxID=2975380 RepID=UPI00244C5F62|nr:hypothetical protein [Stenotrophomonas sp. GD03777]MDH1659883.1 hypothetical protein [Stenotrophomonas sp. GD03777]